MARWYERGILQIVAKKWLGWRMGRLTGITSGVAGNATSRDDSALSSIPTSSLAKRMASLLDNYRQHTRPILAHRQSHTSQRSVQRCPLSPKDSRTARLTADEHCTRYTSPRPRNADSYPLSTGSGRTGASGGDQIAKAKLIAPHDFKLCRC